MVSVRRATAGDAAELVRLRGVMLGSFPEGLWRGRGRRGHVGNVATDPAYRRRGFSRACLTAALQWFAERDVRVVDLRASPEGEPLYASLGFARTSDPAMRLRLGPVSP